MSSPPLRVAILIVSDTAYQDASTDKAREVLSNVFTQHDGGNWSITSTEIVPDVKDKIANKVKSWCEDGINLVVTTGGTGFATKDVTPEAIEPLLQRKAPGLVHGMLAKSLEITPFAMMARPIAGTRGSTIIITLPGSPKGAKENLEAIIKLLPHACQQAAGMDSRTLHSGGVKKLENEAGVTATKQHSHSHNHHHGLSHGHAVPRAHTKPEDRPQSNNPDAGPSQRYRSSPYPMISVQEAIETILGQVPEPRTSTEPVDSSLLNHIVAKDIHAKEAVPAFRASIVDGYAVVAGTSNSTKGVFPVAAVSHAAPGERKPLQAGQVARITTGAPLPDGANAVVMVEDTVLKSMTDDGKEEKEVEILTDAIKPEENVRAIGSDIQQSSLLLKCGDKIGPGEIGLVASVGITSVEVFAKPTVGVLSTGNEIIPHDRNGSLKLGEVRDCNKPAILALLHDAGYNAHDYGMANDVVASLETKLRDSLRGCDVLITSGGVSMGELDLLKPTIERSIGGIIHVGRVNMKPGKPTTFATVVLKDNHGHDRKKLIFCLPGNPASAMTCTSLFVLPALDKFSGSGCGSEKLSWNKYGRPRFPVVLGENVYCDNSREEYQRATITPGEEGFFMAHVTGGQRSSRIGSFQRANALVILPAGGGKLAKGTEVEALLIHALT